MKKTRLPIVPWCLLGLAICSLAAPSLADPKLWTGATSADWFTDGNWSPANVPVAGDDVTIDGSATITNVWLTNSTAFLNSFTLTNATLTFTNWDTTLTATNVSILKGGLLTHALCDTNAVLSNSNRVNIVCTNFILDAGGTIDVNGKGYRGGSSQLGAEPWGGQGPGGGKYGGGWYGGGGAYGGGGGVSYYAPGVGGRPYGLTNAPVEPGSGGAGHLGGNGGGAVRIDAAGSAAIRGVITANGMAAPETWCGGGSGGGIYITCARLEGNTNGLLSVNAGAGGSTSAGGGGGGRVAVIFDPAAQTNRPGVRYAAASGTGGLPYGSAGDVGTIYFPTTSVFLAETLADGLFAQGRLIVPGFTNWAPDSLAVGACAITFEPGFRLTVTHNVLLDSGAALTFSLADSRLDCGGDWALTNGGTLTLSAGHTNGALDYNGLLSVTGNLSIGSGSWIYPYSNPTNGGSLLFRVGALSLSTNGGIDADGKGFSGSTNYYNLPGYQDGYGPGRSYNFAAWSAGAGYGGGGGRLWDGHLGGVTYGRPEEPSDPGSGAGGQFGGNGGGLVRVEATGTVTICGTISANGSAGRAWGGGGSGGAILVSCQRLDGDAHGLLRVDGGAGTINVPYGAGGGGGGRIAVLYDALLQTANPGVRFSALPGPGGTSTKSALPGDPGSIYLTNTLFLTEHMNGQINGTLLAAGFTQWAPDSLTISNSTLFLGANGFQLTVTNGLTIGSGGVLGLRGNALLSCGGNLTLGDAAQTNGGSLKIYAGTTNGSAPDYGALVNVGGTLWIGSNSWIYPYSEPTNGGSVLFRAGSLLLAATNAGFDANGKGFSGGTNIYTAAGYKDGYGPGHGLNNAAWGSGGGFGGRGGDAYSGTLGGTPYGSSNAPALPGSGAGGQFGGFGGGLVRVEVAGCAVVSGRIMANGAEGWPGSWGGGGSGGGILIICGDTFRGEATAQLSAVGGVPIAPLGGGGGGGRIAIWQYATPEFVTHYDQGQTITPVDTFDQLPAYTGSVSVTNGTGYAAGYQAPTPGTAVFYWRIGRGILIELL